MRSVNNGGGQSLGQQHLTLQEANILCKVTQTATTLRTGDHSFPRIEAQIYIRISITKVHSLHDSDLRAHLNIHAKWMMGRIGRYHGNDNIAYWMYRGLFPIRDHKLNCGGRYWVLRVESEL